MAINDLGGLLTGAFTLVSGSASAVVPFLASGESYSMVYAMMALQSGVFELPAASVITTDLLQNQLLNATDPTTIRIENGLLPSELSILTIAAGFAIIAIIIFIVYRILKRYR